jgi:hypothetical protein
VRKICGLPRGSANNFISAAKRLRLLKKCRVEFMSAYIDRRSIVIWIARQQRTAILLTEPAWSLACLDPFKPAPE